MDAQRIEFELKLAGAKNVKAATCVTTGLEPAGAAGGGEEAEIKRWREIAGLEE